MNWTMLAGSLVLVLAGQTSGQRFPYDAVVDVDDELVRSGSGTKFYPTSRVRKGDTVTVVGHDPGGWRKIIPPPGSFSLIPVEYVEAIDDRHGRVTQNGVIVRVGSELNEEPKAWQVDLSRDDPVEIIGEATVMLRDANTGGPPRSVAMYRIRPLKNEFRWIAGRSLVAKTTAPLTAARDSDTNNSPGALTDDASDPFADGPPARGPAADPSPRATTTPRLGNPAPRSSAQDQAIVERPMVRTPNMADGVRDATPQGEQLAAERALISAIDDRFSLMLKDAPSNWDLASLRRDYEQLQTELDHPSLLAQLRQRLTALKKYDRIQNDYREFLEIATNTRARDTELASRAQANGQPGPPPPAQLADASAAGLPPSPSPSGTPEFPGGAFAGGGVDPSRRAGPSGSAMGPATGRRGAGAPANANGAPAGPNRTPAATVNAGTPQYAGAGVVRKLASPAGQGTVYALLTPRGKLLAYLQPQNGVNLEPWVDQSAGIHGDRAYREELQADVIVVSGLESVILRPTPK